LLQEQTHPHKDLDVIIDMDFRHIANAIVRGKVERLCRAEGYEPPIICTPEELEEEGNG
jgi:hypothetical protein